MSPLTRGDPECRLRWTCKSTYNLQAELQRQGHPISVSSVGNLLKGIGYSLQAPSKTEEGGHHEGRDAQFNHIEHKMFCYISGNWRGKPLTSRQAVVNLISNTTTKTGLKIQAELDENIYQKGRKISDGQLAKINLIKDEFHGNWNYIIKPILLD